METAWTTSLSGDKVLPIGSARRGADGAVAVYERSWPMSYSFEMAMDIVQSPKHMPVFGLLEEFRGGMAGKCTAGLHAGPLGMVAAARDPRSATTEHYIVFDYERPDVARDVFTLEPIQYVDAPGHSNRLTVGDRRLFLGTTEPAGVAVVDLGTHTVIRRVTATSPRVARPEAVRKGAIGTYAWSSGIAFIDDDGNVTTLLDPPSMFGAVKVDATTDDLVWLREETPGGPLVLWTAPFSSTAAALRPRRVTAFESTALSNYLEDAILVNDGYVLVKVNVLEMLLLRLSDGRGWTLAPEPEDQWAWPAFVDRDEVWIAVDKRGLTSRTLRTFVRLRIDAMGEPDVASR